MLKIKNFEPDYQNIVQASCNQVPKRLPLYDHIVSVKIMEQIQNREFGELIRGNRSEQREFFRQYCSFFKHMGYDVVIYEDCVGAAMPGSGALGEHKPGIIRDRSDFIQYPWEEIESLYFEANSIHFELLKETMPQGMKLLGGAGNGIFECVQDIVGFTELCYMKADDPELYGDLFAKVGEMLLRIWARLLHEHSDLICVCRFGDDLGFKSNTLLSKDDIKTFRLAIAKLAAKYLAPKKSLIKAEFKDAAPAKNSPVQTNPILIKPLLPSFDPINIKSTAPANAPSITSIVLL